MRVTPDKQPGFSLLSLLAALAIVGVLYLGFQGLSQGPRAARKELVAAPSVGRQTACDMNRQAASRALLTWNVTHPGQKATLKKLRDSGISLIGCPEGGKFAIHGPQIDCSIHSPRTSDSSETSR